MPKFIKSHSNYRLTSIAHRTNAGTILERDISTVGGVDSFATGQSTIYSSGNFIITVNNTTGASRHVLKKGWVSNTENGDIWNKEVLGNYTSDVNGSVEKSVSIGNDFMDFRQFAVYGSLYGLVETSITDIINRYPYELYIGVSASELPATYTDSNGNQKYYGNSSSYRQLSNPGHIDIHTKTLGGSTVDNPLRFFADEGWKQYSVFDDNRTSPSDGFSFTWSVTPATKKDCYSPGDLLATITITPSGSSAVTIKAYMDNNGDTVYLTTNTSVRYHVRPKPSLSLDRKSVV